VIHLTDGPLPFWQDYFGEVSPMQHSFFDNLSRFADMSPQTKFWAQRRILKKAPAHA
jgi:hypothetical protein